MAIDRSHRNDPRYPTGLVEIADGVHAWLQSDGGWGWFSGFGERSYPHTTAIVVHGLQTAKANDVALVPGMLEKGVASEMTERLIEACEAPTRTLLELGSGGGNNASHMKAHFAPTLVDASAGMLDVSRALNPECEHVEGDILLEGKAGWLNMVFFSAMRWSFSGSIW